MQIVGRVVGGEHVVDAFCFFGRFREADVSRSLGVAAGGAARYLYYVGAVYGQGVVRGGRHPFAVDHRLALYRQYLVGYFGSLGSVKGDPGVGLERYSLACGYRRAVGINGELALALFSHRGQIYRFLVTVDLKIAGDVECRRGDGVRAHVVVDSFLMGVFQ